VFGDTPGKYTNMKAARKVAKAYSMEEDTKWIVVGKRLMVDQGVRTIYKPCRVSDIDQARQDGFYPVEFHLKEEFIFRKKDKTHCANVMCVKYDEDWDHNCTDFKLNCDDFSKCECYIPK